MNKSLKPSTFIDKKIVPLWRTTPAKQVGGNATRLPPERVLPSGRQAIIRLLEAVSFSRQNRVSLPEWSSTCVVSCVGRCVTPIPMTEVVQHQLPVDGILLYEQWGWPISQEAIDHVCELLKPKLLIIDRVDVPYIPSPAPKFTDCIVGEIWSLSKTLGLDGGGLARLNGNWIEALPTHNDKLLYEILSTDDHNNDISHMMKTFVSVTPPSVLDFIAGCNLVETFSEEASKRLSNLEVAAKIAGDEWPFWMKEAIASGAAPGIAPLCRGQSDKNLFKFQDAFKNNGIQTSIYHFDFAAHPVEASYERCLAVPLHGGVNKDIINFVMSS